MIEPADLPEGAVPTHAIHIQGFMHADGQMGYLMQSEGEAQYSAYLSMLSMAMFDLNVQRTEP